MKNTLLCCLLVLGAGLAAAAQLTPQEQQALDNIRSIYARQMGRPPTPAEEEKMLDQWRNSVMAATATAARLSAFAGGNVPLTAPAAAPVPAATPAATAPATVPSEAALATRLEQLGPGKRQVRIERARDGLRIDGAVYLDPEGKIEHYAYDVLSGDITYTLRSGNELVFKFIKAGGAEPVPFARATAAGGGWQVTTATGQTLAGDTVTPTARGLLVARTGSVFLYEPGKGGKGFPVPEGWAVAQFQRGNVGATRFILLERLPVQQGSVQGLINSLRSLGATAGLGKQEDYALMHIEDGRQYPLNVQINGKLQAAMSNCRRRNAIVNECATARSYESLFSDMGRNFGHYFWKIDWYASQSGPVAVTMENGVADVYVLDLASGKKVNAFHRALGITSFDSEQGPDGAIAIRANWLMQDHQIPDAVQFLQAGLDVKQAQQATQ